MHFRLGNGGPSKLIVRPITDDGLVGYDEFGQLMLTQVDGDRQTSFGVVDVRTKTCIICRHGWEPNSISMVDQVHWDLVRDYVHESCLATHRGLRDRSDFYEAIVAAKMRFFGLNTTPNGYWGSNSNWGKYQPWYTAELMDYPVIITLGWRKRVANVQFDAQGGAELAWWEKAKESFAGEDVTKEFSPRGVLLHAWSVEKMKTYVKQISELAGYNKRIEPEKTE